MHRSEMKKNPTQRMTGINQTLSKHRQAIRFNHDISRPRFLRNFFWMKGIRIQSFSFRCVRSGFRGCAEDIGRLLTCFLTQLLFAIYSFQTKEIPFFNPINRRTVCGCDNHFPFATWYILRTHRSTTHLWTLYMEYMSNTGYPTYLEKCLHSTLVK